MSYNSYLNYERLGECINLFWIEVDMSLNLLQWPLCRWGLAFWRLVLLEFLNLVSEHSYGVHLLKRPYLVFAGSELKVSLDSNCQYAAVWSTASGAPFRSITVRDTIGDLPDVKNGASITPMEVKCFALGLQFTCHNFLIFKLLVASHCLLILILCFTVQKWFVVLVSKDDTRRYYDFNWNKNVVSIKRQRE